jgi:hypothetical protein
MMAPSTIEDLPSTVIVQTDIFIFIFSGQPLVRRTCVKVLRKGLGLIV